MSNRHALLIGIPQYHDDARLNEDSSFAGAVRSDITMMREALEASGYLVSECASGQEGGATRTRIRHSLRTACKDVPEGGVLLIYFSGHGIAIDGVDYLVPSDATLQYSDYEEEVPSTDAAWSADVLDGLLRVLPDEGDDGFLRACKAGLVLFAVDACRTERSGRAAPEELGGRQPYLAGDGQFVLLMGCAAGQICQFDETGSAFTKYLARSLDPSSPARTLKAVVDDVMAGMERWSRNCEGETQRPVIRNPRVLELTAQVEVCDGDGLADAWRKAVRDSELFRLCADQDQVEAVVEECAHQLRTAHETLSARTQLTDPWTDRSYPGRVLQFTEFLLNEVGLLPGGLRAGEASMLVAAPFLREAVLAEGIRVAAGIDPGNFTVTYEDGARRDLEIIHDMHQHLVRRVTGLRRHNAGAADRLVMWLVHQWLGGWTALWEDGAAEEVCGRGSRLIGGCAGSMGDHEVQKLVHVLLRVLGADPGDARLVRRLALPYVTPRWRHLAAVLWLAGILASDPRRLPPVVPDQVGTRMELPLPDIRAKARTEYWIPAPDETFDLDLACEHPALHAAFEDIARRATAASEAVRKRLDLPGEAVGRMPRRFTTRHLRPVTRRDDKPAYEVPLSRFQIAEDKVRELFMGHQLYGEPELAIRELYQNALDACRWRETREAYLKAVGQSGESPGVPASWAGHIRFTQGADEDGRPYIDCEDNGVGMGFDTLRNVFANAGERFVFGQEFRAEQAAWAEQGLRMIPNSQFGVGVFSYFMLADEITVVTRHQCPDGHIEHDAHEVQITSSGSLFQIRTVSGMPNGGTRVRLYLGGDAEGISVLKVLRDILWVAEHQVEAKEPGDSEIWPAGVLRYTGDGETPLKCGSDFWWVPGNGGLAADGIKTGEELPGMVVNLRAEHRPQFTVDRKTLRAWDRGWVDNLVGGSLSSLMRWPGFTFSWLWDVTAGVSGSRVEWKGDVEVAQRIFAFAVAEDAIIVAANKPPYNILAPLSAIGCVPADKSLFPRLGPLETADSRKLPDGLRIWRESVWRNQGPFMELSPEEEVTQIRTRGYPGPAPVEGMLLQALPEKNGLKPNRDALRIVAEKLKCPEPETLRRIRRYTIAGFNLTEWRSARGISQSPGDEDDIDEALLANLAPWPPPGSVDDVELVKRLIRACPRDDRPLDVGYVPFAEVLDRVQALSGDPRLGLVPDLRALVDRTCPGIWQCIDEIGTWSVISWLEHEDTVAPAELIEICDSKDIPMGELLRNLDLFAPLGLVVENRESYPDDLDENGIEFEALRYIYKSGHMLELLCLAHIAEEFDVSVEFAHGSLERLEGRGFLNRPRLDDRPNDIKSRYLSAQGRVDDSDRWGDPVWIHTVKLIVQGVAEEDEYDDDDGQLLAAAQELVYLDPPDSLTLADLAELSYRLRMPLAKARKSFQKVYPDVEVPPIPRGGAGLAVHRWLGEKLLARSPDGTSWRSEPGDIVSLAVDEGISLGDCLNQLAPFRSPAGPFPSCDEPTQHELDRVRVDKLDVNMLRVPFTEWYQEQYLHSISALHLVRTAGRFGWTLAETHRRFARLVPIGLELAYPQVELPDEIVWWYDLQVLTRYFDGWEPVISKVIDREHLRIAAVEIFYDASPEELPERIELLADRLRLYAPLFSLELHI